MPLTAPSIRRYPKEVSFREIFIHCWAEVTSSALSPFGPWVPPFVYFSIWLSWTNLQLLILCWLVCLFLQLLYIQLRPFVRLALLAKLDLKGSQHSVKKFFGVYIFMSMISASVSVACPPVSRSWHLVVVQPLGMSIFILFCMLIPMCVSAADSQS